MLIYLIVLAAVVALIVLGVNTYVTNFVLKLDTIETINSNDFNQGFSSNTHNGFDQLLGAFTNTGTTPTITACSYQTYTLVSGTLNIDLTALVGLNGITVNGTGLQVRGVIIVAPNTNLNPITVTPGASNGYPLKGASFSETFSPSDSDLRFIFAGSGAIGPTSKIIKLAGTGSADVLQIGLVMG